MVSSLARFLPNSLKKLYEELNSNFAIIFLSALSRQSHWRLLIRLAKPNSFTVMTKHPI